MGAAEHCVKAHASQHVLHLLPRRLAGRCARVMLGLGLWLGPQYEHGGISACRLCLNLPSQCYMTDVGKGARTLQRLVCKDEVHHGRLGLRGIDVVLHVHRAQHVPRREALRRQVSIRVCTLLAQAGQKCRQ